MFRLSKITDYGILLLAHMASRNELDAELRASADTESEGAGVVTARELAEQVDLPLPIVSKILKSLAREGTIESHRGAKGGYSLRVEADRITVAEMISVLEGPVAMTECSVSTGLCLHENSCSVRQPWQMINKVVQDALGDITLADLARADATTPRPLDRFIRTADQQRDLATLGNTGGADHE